MIFLDWLDGGEDLRCLEEDETIPLSRGPVGKTFLTFNYLYINKVRYKISYCSFRNANNICIFARKVLQTTFQALFSFMMMNLTTLLSVKLPRINYASVSYTSTDMSTDFYYFNCQFRYVNWWFSLLTYS